MKSLEKLKHIENAPEFMGGDERYKRSINSPIRYIEDITAIKQDLEVLEIIRKKDVNLATLKLCIIRTDTIEQLLSKYNKSRYFTQDELTMEELLKLKQWLEVNE